MNNMCLVTIYHLIMKLKPTNKNTNKRRASRNIYGPNAQQPVHCYKWAELLVPKSNTGPRFTTIDAQE